MQRYLGIDVHAESSTVVVLSESGKKVSEARLETNGQALVGFLRQTPGDLRICLEEGEWSQWLVEVLSPHAAEVVAYRPQWRPGAKNDRLDAQVLAERLRTGRIGCPVYKAPRRWSKLRELVRLYGKMTSDVVRSKQRLRGFFRRRGIRCPAEELYDQKRRGPWLRKLPPGLRPAAKLQALELDCQKDIRDEVEGEMLEEARRFAALRILQTAPGIGPIRAAQLLAIVVTPHRFREKRQFWSYCGFGVVTRTSSDWVQGPNGWNRASVVQTRGLSRACNRQLKSIFKGAATTVIRHSAPNPLKTKYEDLLEAGTRPNLAKLTIARTIAAIVLAMWKTQTEYRPTTS